MNSPLNVRRALLALAAWPVAAPALDLTALAGGAGSGKIVHHEVDVAAFRRIEVGGDLRIDLVQRQPPRVLIDTDDDVLPLLEVESSGGLLTLRRRGRVTPTRLRIVVQVWALDRIDASGSAAVNASGLAAKTLSVEASGSSVLRFEQLTAETLAVEAGGSAQIRLGGQANELQAALGGAAALQASELEVRRVGVKLGGAAAARVWALDVLAGAIGGSAQLRYRGEPRVDVARGGAAGVSRL